MTVQAYQPLQQTKLHPQLTRLTPWAVQVVLGGQDHLPDSRLMPLEQSGADELTFTAQETPYALTWTYQGQEFMQDHPERAYVFTRGGDLRHTRVQKPESELTYGLGEVSGPLQKNGRLYTLDPKDALGYDPETGDPMYKLE